MAAGCWLLAVGSWMLPGAVVVSGFSRTNPANSQQPSASHQLGSDPPQPLTEKLFAATEPDSQVALEPDVRTRNDEGAPIDSDALSERQAGGVPFVTDLGDRSCLRLAPGEAAAESGYPLGRLCLRMARVRA